MPNYEPEGRMFESCRAHQLPIFCLLLLRCKGDASRSIQLSYGRVASKKAVEKCKTVGQKQTTGKPQKPAGQHASRPDGAGT